MRLDQCYVGLVQVVGVSLAPWAFAVVASAAATTPVESTVSVSAVSYQPEPLALSGQIELARLVDLAAERVGVNLEYDPATISGTVTLRTGAGVGGQDLWDLLNRSLAVRGLTTIRVGAGSGGEGGAPDGNADTWPALPSYAVVRIADAAALAPRERITDEPPGPLPGFRVVLVLLLHQPAAALTEAIAPVLSRSGGSVGTLSPTGPVVIADLSPRVAEALAIVRALDVPAAPPRLLEVPLRTLSGAQMVALVEQVVTRRDAVAGRPLAGEVLASPDGSGVLVVAPEAMLGEWTSLIGALDRRQSVETATYTPRYFAAADVAGLVSQTVADSTDDRWKIVVDSLTGSLVITATPLQHGQVRELLARLDEAPSAVRRPVRAIRVRNRSVLEMRDIVEQLVSSGFLESQIEAGSAAGSAGSDPDATRSRDLATGFTPAPGSQTTRASPVLPDQREAQDPQTPGADRRQPGEAGVSLAVDEATSTLIAIGDPRVLSQIEALVASLDVRQPQVMLEVLMVTLTDTQSRDLGVELESIGVSDDVVSRVSSLFGLGRRTPEGDLAGPLSAQGLTGVVLNPGDFSVVVRALRNVTRGRSLSMPRVLVGNNQEATLDAVVQQPVLSVNASDTIATTSFGGTQDAGTIVTVRPQIAEGDHLVLEYNVSLSSFIGSSANPSLPPPRQQNSVASTATIPDGHTVVVGGIEVDSHSTGKSDVPGFGDIPILGDILSSRSRDDSRSRFYVFIRASVLRASGFEDLRHLSAPAMEQAGVPDGWPRITPVVMP